MGCFEAIQPAFGKEGITPAMMIRTSTTTFPVTSFSEYASQPHPNPAVPRFKGVFLRKGHTPSPHGFPVLRSISVYRHAVVNTPVARWALIARGTAYSNRFPVPSGGGLPHHCARSATTLDFSRPAQRSLAITACRFAESPIATRLSRRLRRFRFLPASLR